MLTAKTLKSAKPSTKPYFIRSHDIKGFAAKVNASGTIRYVVEIKHQGKSLRKTIGTYPVLPLSDAKSLALQTLQQLQTGYVEPKTLRKLFDEYIKNVSLKPNTSKNYMEVIGFYLKDWLKLKVDEISKSMVERRFNTIRDKGVFGGKPTYSQATKTMRILSALMNYAIADDLIQQNPVEVLKLKRVDRSIKKREHYLPADKAKELLAITASERHPVTLAVNLMLRTGLRRNEALRLKWSDLEDIEGTECIIVRDTKNHQPHFIPITKDIKKILEQAENPSDFIFPSPSKPNCPISDVRPTLRRLSKLIGIEFKCHDLRRTFATRAAEVGIDYLMVKRLLNHRSSDITAQYIQWNSRKNLLVMKEALEQVRYTG